MENDDDQGERPPTDEAGWRKLVAEGRINSVRIEAIVAAVQEIGPDGDPRVINPLMGHISDSITDILNGCIGRNKSDREEIIDRAQMMLIEAILQPNSADGIGLRQAFRARVKFRAADAIRAEDLHRSREMGCDDYDGFLPPPQDGHWSHVEQNAYVGQILETISDPRKRLAFSLHMERVPITSDHGASIAKALGISGKTIGEWIKEIQENLKRVLGEE